MKKLPDKGAKIQQMIDRVKEVLQQRKDVDHTADLFEKMALDAENTQRNRLGHEVLPEGGK